jgi:hypothetical protein
MPLDLKIWEGVYILLPIKPSTLNRFGTANSLCVNLFWHDISILTYFKEVVTGTDFILLMPKSTRFFGLD